MAEVIKVDVDERTAKQFGEKVAQIYGYKRGAMKRALETLIKQMITESKPDWSALQGVIKSDKTSTAMQHGAFKR
jgi:uncharacterized protein involved in tellurium resistance